MGASAHKIASGFIGAAQREPDNRSEIFRRAAYTFMGLAQDPKNAPSQKQLVEIGLQFANAVQSARPPTMDDFVDLLQETRDSYHEVGDDPMDLVARRREIHDDRTKVDPGHVSIAPSSFNKDATLGRSQKIKWAPNGDEISAQGILQSQNVAFWQGVKKEAQAMTVDISLGFLPVSNRGDAPANMNVRPYAEIEFGSDGNRTTFRCDVSLGTRLTVVGNYIAATVGMGPPRLGMDSAVITAGASIGAFAAPSLAPVILTEYVDFLQPSQDTALIPIPLKAVQLLPVQTNLALGDALFFYFYDYGGTLILQNFYLQANNSPMSPIPITGDVAFIVVHNASAHTANVRLPFQLAV